MSWLSSSFGGGGSYTNPADVAMPYLDEVPGQIDKYYNNYIGRGRLAGNTAQRQLGQMTRNPTDYYNDIYSDYEVSPYSEYQTEQMLDAAGNSAASGGFSGTENDQQNQMEIVNAMLSKDWQQYLDNILGIQKTGLGGEMSMYNTGFGASSAAQGANQKNSMEQAGLAYAGQANENAYNMAQSNAFMKMLSDALGASAEYLFSPSAGATAAEVATLGY